MPRATTTASCSPQPPFASQTIVSPACVDATTLRVRAMSS